MILSTSGSTLCKLPVRKGKKYQGKSFRECIEIAKREGDAPLNAYTLNNYLDKIKAVFAFAEETKKILHSPVGVYRVSKKVLKGRGVDSVTREPFSDGDLEKVFSIPCYTGCMGRGRQNASGRKIVHNEKFWVPLIALFSGARLGEISQLGCSQVSNIDGIPCFQISDDMPQQSLKNEGSKRVVPLHSMLIELGLLNYVEHVSRESDFLFPALISKGRQSHGRIISRWFNETVLDKVIGIKRPELVFHSFRHTFATAAAGAGVDSGLLDSLCGWSSDERSFRKQDMRENYIMKGVASVPVLQDTIEKIQFSFLQLEHLRFVSLRRTETPLVFVVVSFLRAITCGATVDLMKAEIRRTGVQSEVSP